MQDTRVTEVHKHVGQTVRLQGWLYNKRASKKLQFLQVRDGSGIIQAIVAKGDVGEELFAKADALTQESAIRVQGVVQEDARSPLGYELHVSGLELVSASADYPISKKAHGDAFLLDHRHLWLRSRKQHLILRVRHTLTRAIRDYFDNHGFVLVDSPILTPNACEGTTTLFSTEYFDERQAFLTQSGQLYQEAACMAFGKTYCFGPTFRAEKSKTRRHLTEFWMVEPEVAYLDLEGDMDLAEDFLCYVIGRTLEVHGRELETVLERDLSALQRVEKPFPRLSYDQALQVIQDIRGELEDSERRNQLEIAWGADFGSPHETELTKRYDRPVMVYNYPAAVKAFYMKRDADNPELSRSVDVLAPEGYGEIIGGGQREDSLEALESAIQTHQLPFAAFEWFLDLRRYGSVPHAGFGMGLERAVAWICGLHHVRETIPFPRTMDRLEP